jgi:NADPH2:quinone reductase
VTEPQAVRARIARFGRPEVLKLEEFAPRKGTRRKVRVRVTHTSVGSTDAAARSGDYLLQPRPGFIPGYDFVESFGARGPGHKLVLEMAAG